MQNLGRMLAHRLRRRLQEKQKNSKGYEETWTGYKFHIDVACGLWPNPGLLRDDLGLHPRPDCSLDLIRGRVAIPLMTM
jgi:hypothetical protein